ncbi:SGNH/GDSL hydrolase family protein [Mycetocola zhujimingii]|uniref:SGNH/GDSL hydrolase family protein n=1 Tax=Mycetocola zhujimingii TaxID=2079792 RepID=A0A2U1TC53_9MICO|nr:SGNH/GDSL hydrolase family protein [Mycetocola zhujimingii]AWB87598.1 GDSL family lipase [Mycetocola zhujimingii]PWC06380.1 SGNH/GDSL hydrolase family protein [Mycetocola zhujimingii]
MTARYFRYVALGDSFTEGVGDELPDGRVRGWADFVALGLQAAAHEPIGYANLAIRGRKLGPIIAEQLEPALALKPDLISFNGGGNDIMRPRVAINWVVDETVKLVNRALEEPDLSIVVLAGANPSRHLPMGGLMQKRGDQLADAVFAALKDPRVTIVNNWADETLTDIRYWSPDKLHLNALGHARVASNVLTALGVPVPPEWGVDEVAAAASGPRSRNTAAYYREFVLPWIGRRVTGRSSGDGREPKRATLLPVD